MLFGDIYPFDTACLKFDFAPTERTFRRLHVLDVQPTRPHDFAARQELLGTGRVSAGYMTVAAARKHIFWQIGDVAGALEFETLVLAPWNVCDVKRTKSLNRNAFHTAIHGESVSVHLALKFEIHAVGIVQIDHIYWLVCILSFLIPQSFARNYVHIAIHVGHFHTAA